MQKLITSITLVVISLCPLLAQQSLLYKVEKKGHPTSYLFGTFHLLPQDKFHLPEEVTSVFNSAKQVVMELSMEPGFELKLMQLAQMKDGVKLEDLLSPNEIEILDSALASTGMPRTLLNNWRPFFITSLFYQSYMPGGIASHELTFAEMARERGLPIIGLETIERQIQVFDKISYESQARDLMEMISDFETNKAKFDRMVKVYLEGNAKEIYALSEEDLDNEKEIEILLTQRNREWIPKLENLLEEASFVAVGAGHLGGKEGVVSLLKKRGFKLTQVKN